VHPAPSFAAADGTVIAYIAPSRDNKSIRIVSPDGVNDRAIWQAPADLNRTLGPGDLSWRPDAAELAFDSAHDLLRSMLVRDIYALASDGSYLRRLTRAPDTSSYDLYPKGTVTFTLTNSAFARELDVHIEGSKDTARVRMPANTVSTLTFSNVADFGSGIQQYVRLFVVNSSGPTLNRYCFFNIAWSADVVANRTVTIGDLATGFNDNNCPLAISPTWREDGKKAAYLLREATSEGLPPNNIWQADVAPSPATYGDRLLDYRQFDPTSDPLYLVAYGRGTRQDQLIFVQRAAVTTPIYLAPAADAANRSLVDLGPCPRVTCWVTGLSWLPDGSGFVFARLESGTALSNAPPAGGVIYRYDLSAKTYRQVFRAPNEALGRLTVSPDGQTIAVERAASLEDTVERVTLGPKLLCPCSIWTMSIDGAGAKQLVADGRAPAWSPVAPVVVPPGTAPGMKPTNRLPIIRRDP
jgi:hypothetical protein